MNMQSAPDCMSGNSYNRQKTREKSFSDVAALLKSARFVIVLNEDNSAFQVVSNQPPTDSSVPHVSLIAVVGITSDEDGYNFPASMLEIGYRRVRPYRRVHTAKNQVLLWARNPKPQLTAQQIELVYPEILNCLEAVLAETRARWKHQEGWWINGRKVERGVQITIHTSDHWLRQLLLAESVRYLRICLFPNYARWLNRRLKYSRSNSYPKKLYGPSVRRAANSIMASELRHSPLLVEALFRKVKKRLLLENALRSLHNFTLMWDEEAMLVYGDIEHRPPLHPSPLFFWKTTDQPGDRTGAHAQDCVRFEVIFDRANARRTDMSQFLLPEWHKVTITEEQKNDPDFCPF